MADGARRQVDIILTDRERIAASTPQESISDLLVLRAQAQPQAPFLVELDEGERRWSYGGFVSLVARTAATFKRLGITKLTHVAVALPNCADAVAAWMALSRLGAIAVGVNPGMTEHELDYVIETAKVEYIAARKSLAQTFAETKGRKPIADCRIIEIDDLGSLGSDATARGSTDTTDRDLSRHDLDAPASILFTSGSSGRPKAALLPHRWHSLMGHARANQGPHVSNVLIETPIYYMGGQWRLAMAIMSGATVILAAQPTIKKFVDRLLTNGVEFSSLPVPLAKQAGLSVPGGLSLKWMATSGLPKELHAALEEQFGAPICEIYGSTEMGSTIVVPTLATALVGSGSCGLPAIFRTVRIVGLDEQEVRQGEIGELQVRGPGMLQGYFNAPEATANSFQDGWFRTGDLFRQDRDGYFYWVARAKDIVRRSNENISAVEVEEEVARLTGVLEACVVPVPDEFRGEEVKVYVRLQEGFRETDITPGQIDAHCRARLSAHKCPRYVEYVSEFPRTISQKISKPMLKAGKPDLRAGSFDLLESRWHS
jgi:long-chain acyl-CoA synthetase